MLFTLTALDETAQRRAMRCRKADSIGKQSWRRAGQTARSKYWVIYLSAYCYTGPELVSRVFGLCKPQRTERLRHTWQGRSPAKANQEHGFSASNQVLMAAVIFLNYKLELLVSINGQRFRRCLSLTPTPPPTPPTLPNHTAASAQEREELSPCTEYLGGT